MTAKTSTDPFYQKIEPLFTSSLVEALKERNISCTVTKVALKICSTGGALCVLQFNGKNNAAVRCLPEASLKILREQMAFNQSSCLEEHVKEMAQRWLEVERVVLHTEEPLTDVGWFAMSCRRVFESGIIVDPGLDMFDPEGFLEIIRSPDNFFKKNVCLLPDLFKKNKESVKPKLVEIVFEKVLGSCEYNGTKYLELSKVVCQFFTSNGVDVGERISRAYRDKAQNVDKKAKS